VLVLDKVSGEDPTYAEFTRCNPLYIFIIIIMTAYFIYATVKTQAYN
jgi:hypothetical protein